MADRTTLEQGPGTHAELARLEEENLRLRDLLIGKDAELGALRGQLAIHEDQMRRLHQAMGLLHGRVPGLRRLLGAVLRRLQGRPQQ